MKREITEAGCCSIDTGCLLAAIGHLEGDERGVTEARESEKR